MANLQPGDHLSHFTILSLLGRGGMGVVYLARDELLRRCVALKVLHASQESDPVLRARLLREARAAARLNHPGIAAVYEVGAEDGCDFVAMEYVQGSTLRALMEASGGRIAPELAIDYARQAAEALAAAHAAGLAHRDVKPENLMVTSDGQVKVLDFGLARRYETSAPDSAPALTRGAMSMAETVGLGATDPGLTRAGRTAGTPAYMSPEQVRGQTATPASDVFSLGVVIQEMLTGRSPFARPLGAQTLQAILHERAPALGASMPGLQDVVRTALEKEPDRRYRSGRELADALSALQARRGRRRPGAGRILPAAVAAALIVLAGAAYFLWARRGPSAPGAAPPRTARIPESAGPPPGIRLRPLRVGAGVDQHPDFSPDGQRIVFVRDGHLAMMPAASGAVAVEPTPLTSSQPGGASEMEPAWSPDGNTIAFTREGESGAVEVCAVPAEGGPVRRVVIGASTPSWSPDGRRIAFVQRGLGRSSTILTVQADGQWSRPVTRPEAAYFHLEPAWSPDGKTIAFVKDPGGGSATEIWLVASDGEGEPRQLTNEAEGVYSSAPAWTPDGRWVVYASNRAGTRNLWKIPVEGGEPVRLTAGQGEDYTPRVSPDGRRVAFAISRDQTALLVSDGAPRRERSLVVDPVAVLWGPTFSPDGRFIAYTRIDKAGPWDLYIAPAGGGAPRRLETGGVWPVWPRWSPDGSRIAYCTFGKGDDDIFVMPASGGAPRQLTRGDGDDWWPAWSPDGRTIVFSRTEGAKTYLYSVPALGGRATRLSDESLTLPDFSPDGRFIAVARNRSYRNGVGILPVDGGELRWLSDTGGWPVFRPDGKAVGFVRLEPRERQSLWEAPVSGGPPHPIEGSPVTFWNFPFDYGADGKTLVYSNNLALESDLWMLELP